MKKYSILFICLLITLSHVVAQVKPVSISVDFKDLSIQDFVKEIESKANYHFYYNPIEFDSIRVTLSARNESVSAILRLAFRNTSFSYTIDPNNNVFLTKGVEILASLPYGIFENEKDSLSWQMQ
ncbi:MAG TPA: STN domain-containing protein, partial [Daejeonella sp.]|nr:STN domain-containing protein [Daejeonella sp.]